MFVPKMSHRPSVYKAHGGRYGGQLPCICQMVSGLGHFKIILKTMKLMRQCPFMLVSSEEIASPKLDQFKQAGVAAILPKTVWPISLISWSQC